MGGYLSIITPSIERVINKDNIYYGVPQITIKDVQAALNQAGFECGTPDGSAGPATMEALNAYQESNGLPVTTDITSDLLEKMGIEK